MTDDILPSLKNGVSEKEVAFDYIKSTDFKVVWADGAVGSITPNGMVHFALYAERPAIPRRQIFEIEPLSENQGRLKDEILEKQISRGSIVREMAVDVFVTPQTARNLALWLIARADETKETPKGKK